MSQGLPSEKKLDEMAARVVMFEKVSFRSSQRLIDYMNHDIASMSRETVIGSLIVLKSSVLIIRVSFHLINYLR